MDEEVVESLVTAVAVWYMDCMANGDVRIPAHDDFLLDDAAAFERERERCRLDYGDEAGFEDLLEGARRTIKQTLRSLRK